MLVCGNLIPDYAAGSHTIYRSYSSSAARSAARSARGLSSATLCNSILLPITWGTYARHHSRDPPLER